MNAADSRFRKNFIIASSLHVALIGGIIFWESVFSEAGRPVMASVDLYTPADILGDLPKGTGHGRGAYAPPKEPAGANEVAGPNEAMSPGDETTAPAPKAVPAPRSDPNDIAIPKKTTRKKETTEEKKKAESGKTAATTANAAPTVPKKSATSKTAAKTGSSAAKGSGMGSAEDIKNRFAKALAATEGGTPYGDGQTAGGGTGKSNRIGSPTGSADGVVGGVGQGSPYWQYYEHVHDKMYAAWEQPAELLQKGLTTTLRIRIAKDGSISDVELARSSGNKLLDESARAAANKVHLLEPPPEGLVKGSSAEITVDFQMEGQG